MEPELLLLNIRLMSSLQWSAVGAESWARRSRTLGITITNSAWSLAIDNVKIVPRGWEDPT